MDTDMGIIIIIITFQNLFSFTEHRAIDWNFGPNYFQLWRLIIPSEKWILMNTQHVFARKCFTGTL